MAWITLLILAVTIVLVTGFLAALQIYLELMVE
jgi:hypothetical protein